VIRRRKEVGQSPAWYELDLVWLVVEWNDRWIRTDEVTILISLSVLWFPEQEMVKERGNDDFCSETDKENVFRRNAGENAACEHW
jgi:hypothetical protein